MDNIMIVYQLLNGNHLEKNELIQAERILIHLEHEVNERLANF